MLFLVWGKKNILGMTPEHVHSKDWGDDTPSEEFTSSSSEEERKKSSTEDGGVDEKLVLMIGKDVDSEEDAPLYSEGRRKSPNHNRISREYVEKMFMAVGIVPAIYQWHSPVVIDTKKMASSYSVWNTKSSII